MCLAVPYRVVAVGEDRVQVDMGGVVRDAFVATDDAAGLAVGDLVLVNGSIVLRRLDAAQARIVSAAADSAYGVDAPGRAEPIAEDA